MTQQLPSARALRHVIHQHPDLSGAEGPTAQRVLDALELTDIPDIDGGRIFRIGDERTPAIALRAELDALPIREKSGQPWASTNGAMHACGHDIHLAALVAVIKAIKAVGPILPVVGLLQPREETVPSGAPDFLDSPQMKQSPIASVLGAHVQPQLPDGTFSAAGGAVNAAVDDFEVTINASGGHAGYPHTTGDPILAAAAIVTTLQGVVARSIDPTHPSVITVGSLQSGSAPNVIPSTAILSGTIRSFDPGDRELLCAKVHQVSESLTAIHSCSVTVTTTRGEPILVNDLQLAEAASSWITARTSLIKAPPLRTCGADDFAFYGAAYPSLMVFVGVGAPDGPGLHHEAFCPGDEIVDRVAEVLLAAYLAACQVELGPVSA